MAPDPGKWERMAFIPKSRYVADPPTPAEHGPIPLYSSLAQRWASAGRTVPGVPDLEWERLTKTPIWPR
ncbi:hypothetical protein [Streptomyces sp. NBC_01216]|uniref:hypothetical protein n=1 Tax=unclassified Streptomyces TaxID=2593676 RepID=UPI002E0DDF41|nr:hypothetical protein OG393_10975 [Streptomyces sp. NBC_01216]